MFKKYLTLPKEVWILSLGTLINNIGNVTSPFLTLIISIHLGYSAEITGLLLALKTIISVIGVSVGGVLTDRIGRKKVIVLFGTVAVIGYMACAFSSSLPTRVIGLLAIVTFFQSCMDPASVALMMDVVETDRQRDAFSLQYIGINIGFAIGPLLAAILYKNALGYLFMIDGLTLGISVMLTAMFVKERYHVSKIATKTSMISHVLKNRQLSWFVVSAILIFIVFFQYSFGLPLQMEQFFGIDAGASLYAILMSANAITVVVATVFIMHAVKKFSYRDTIILGAFFYAIGFGMYGISSTWVLAIIATILWSLGEILVSSTVNPYISEMSPPELHGRLSALFPLIRRLAAFISPLAGGWIIGSLGIGALWPLLAITAVGAGFILKLTSK